MSEKRNPMLYTAREVANWHVAEEFVPGKWRPARPCPIYGWRFRERLRLAWWVFTGRCDALWWGDQSGEWSNDQVAYKDINDKGFKLAGDDEI